MEKLPKNSQKTKKKRVYGPRSRIFETSGLKFFLILIAIFRMNDSGKVIRIFKKIKATTNFGARNVEKNLLRWFSKVVEKFSKAS